LPCQLEKKASELESDFTDLTDFTDSLKSSETEAQLKNVTLARLEGSVESVTFDVPSACRRGRVSWGCPSLEDVVLLTMARGTGPAQIS
jgi:hypothetical protein